MQIILVGGGKVGAALCRSLVEENHDVILIEQKESVLKHLTKRYDIMGLLGNGANHKILEQADIQECDIFIAMTDKDEVNMIAAVLAKQMGAKDTIVRVRNPEYSNTYFKERNFLGFSLVVNPELLTARYIANSIDFPNAKSVEHFVNGRVMLMEFSISAESNLTHLTISQFRKKFGNIVICAVQRQGDILIPDGENQILPGDRIFVTGNRVEMALFHNFVKRKLIKNMMIIGAGRIGYYLLYLLHSTKVNLKVIERDEAHAQWLSQEFPQLNIVVGDGTAKDVLLEESAASYDAVATLTGVDEENIIASLFLEKLGVQKNITKVNRTSLLEIIDHDFVSSSIVTPKSIAADAVMHFIRGRDNAQDSNLDALHHIANGRIETLQFEIREKNKMAGQQLSSIRLKDNVLIAAIIRKGRTIYPTGEDVLEVGDKIVVITMLKNITHIYDLMKRSRNE
ncbi:potassium transporter TrkA [Streptococcus agalactiae LMG 14747]|uniref:Trk system potassium uptake protein TrkA n=1 Tax=Streptococcus agalactiae LMG 14747 TaxID=1154860 RepID=V6Z6P5_STRAG|nr:Trk system potassium transporter TrkA [Streptococcus hyovaginalis]ESV55284.1 potassium transporter TrkA [Streptococcus agalactiae LMG 14747]MDY3025214.1 Trk system potassium transporter TrkA [Streptococcus hyovaginalis]